MKKAIEEYLTRAEAREHEKQEDLQRWQQYQDTGDYLNHDKIRMRLTYLADQAHQKATE